MSTLRLFYKSLSKRYKAYSDVYVQDKTDTPYAENAAAHLLFSKVKNLDHIIDVFQIENVSFDQILLFSRTK